MKLPYSVQEIADVIGVERALFLIGQLPRCYVRDPRYPAAQSSHVILYVPTLQRLKPTHELVRILGWDGATKLCGVFGGEILKPANCAGIYRSFRDNHITRLLVEGVPPIVLAEWFDVCDRHVKNIAREIPLEERKPANDNTVPVRKQRARKNNGPSSRHRKPAA